MAVIDRNIIKTNEIFTRETSIRTYDTAMIVITNAFDPPTIYKVYASLDEIAEDFEVGTSGYDAGVAFFNQEAGGNFLIITSYIPLVPATAGKYTSLTQTLSNYTPISDGSFNVTIDGTALDILGLDFTAPVTDIDGVAAVIDDVITGATVTADTDIITITSDNTGATSSILNITTAASGTDISTYLVGGTSIDGTDQEGSTLADFYKDILDNKNIPYFLYSTVDYGYNDQEVIDLLTFNDAIEIDKRFVLVASSDPAIHDETSIDDLAYLMKLKEYNYSSLIYNNNNNDSEYISLALLSRYASQNPGTLSLYGKSLKGITTSKLGTTLNSNILSKNANIYDIDRDFNIFKRETTASSLDIITVTGFIYVEDRTTRVIMELYNTEAKITLDDQGEAIIDQVLRVELNYFANQRIIETISSVPQYTIEYIKSVPNRKWTININYLDPIVAEFIDMNYFVSPADKPLVNDNGNVFANLLKRIDR